MATRKIELSHGDWYSVSDEYGGVELIINEDRGRARLNLDPDQARALARTLNAAAEMVS